MNLLRFLIVLLIGWLLARLVRGFLERHVAKAGASEPASVGTDLVKCEKCGTYTAKNSTHTCGTLVAFLLLFSFMLTAPAHASSGGRYLVELAGSHVGASLEVNGIRVENWSFSGNTTAGTSFNHWLRQGNNTIVVKAAPLGNGRAALRVRVFFMGQGTASVVNLVETDDMTKLRRGTSVSFTLASAPALALWQASAPPEPLGTSQAQALVTDLRAELASVMAVGGGFEDVKSLQTERNDIQRAFGGTATSQPLAIAPQNPQTKVEISSSPAAGDLSVEALGTSGLFRIARKDNSPLVAVRRSGQVSAVNALVVGWMGGAWHILRRAS